MSSNVETSVARTALRILKPPLYALLLILSMEAHADVAQSFSEVLTRVGAVKVESAYTEGPPERVVLNGKIAYEADGTRRYISLLGYFKLRNADVLLLSLGCACSDGNPDPLVFLYLGLNNRIRVITNDAFFSNDFTVVPQLRGEVISVDLGFAAGMKKVAELHAGKLVVGLRSARTRPLANADCSALFERLDECEKPRKYENAESCQDGKIDQWFSRALAGTLRSLSEKPGFGHSKWNAACIAACKGSVIKYDKFSKDVCGISNP